MVNLAPAQRAVERLMTDSCALRRNPGGVDDDVLNPNPGVLTLDPDVVIDPYYTGPCTVRVSQAAANGETGSSSSVPLAVDPWEGDFFEVLSSRDPAIVGEWFRIDQVRGGTFAVTRKLVLAGIPRPPWAAP